MTAEEDELESLRAKTSTGDRLDEAGAGDDAAEEASVEQEANQESSDDVGARTPDSRESDENETPGGSRPDDNGGEQREADAVSGSAEITTLGVEKSEDALVTAINDAFDELEGNDRGLHVWDGDLAALVAVLEANADLKQEVIAALNDQTETTMEIDSQSMFLSCVLRVGFAEVAPELMSALWEARKQRLLDEV
jgi:hypothetical protein